MDCLFVCLHLFKGMSYRKRAENRKRPRSASLSCCLFVTLSMWFKPLWTSGSLPGHGVSQKCVEKLNNLTHRWRNSKCSLSLDYFFNFKVNTQKQKYWICTCPKRKEPEWIHLEHRSFKKHSTSFAFYLHTGAICRNVTVLNSFCVLLFYWIIKEKKYFPFFSVYHADENRISKP